MKCHRWLPRQVSLLSCCDAFVCRTCLGQSYSVEKKLELKRGEVVLQEVEKFYYLGHMISYSVMVEHQRL